jgi:hypothetical protein
VGERFAGSNGDTRGNIEWGRSDKYTPGDL